LFINKYFTLSVLILYIFISGCKKESSSIGRHIQPPGDITKTLFSDTTTLRAFTLADDSITTNNRALSLLGSYNDPVFGLSTASFITQFNLSSNISFGNNPVADSIVIYLRFHSSIYPKSVNISVPQNVSVFKLIKQIYKDSTYYSNKNVSQYYDSTASSLDSTFSFNATDSVLVIRLKKAIADTFLHMSSTGLTNNSQFVSNYFRGLFFKTSNAVAGNAIFYFNLLSDTTKMTLYYRNSDDTLKHNFNFVINSNCSRINLFHHNYTNSVFYSRTTHVDTLQQDSVVYLQSMCGVKVKVSFPFIKDYFKRIGPIAINKAELIINQSTYDITASSYFIPGQLVALMPSVTTTQGYSYLPDYIASTASFDGSYYSNTKSYNFNITMYIQRLIDNKYSNSGILLFSTLNRTSANRVVLNSGKNSNRMKLLITYTKL